MLKFVWQICLTTSNNLNYSTTSYIKYSNIAAKVVRRCVQESAKKEAMKREEQFAKINQWANGKMIKQ